MKRSALMTAIVGVTVVWQVSCTTVVVREDLGPEVLLPGEFIESIDADTIRVMCQGRGPDLPSAIYQARKSCVDWVINNRLAQTSSEKQAYLASQTQVFARLDKYIGIPGPSAGSGSGRGVKSRSRISEYEIQVKIIEHVQEKTLREDLIELGVLASKDSILEAVGMPTIMVHPSKANRGSKDRKIMEDLINSYLTKAKWEVLDPQGVEDLDRLVSAIGQVGDAEEDEAAKLAMAVGADIYIVFEAGKKKAYEGVAYQVGISSYETTTGRKLASESALSAPRTTLVAGEDSAAMMEALNDAMGKIIPQITAYWKDDTPKGNRFTIVLKNAPKNADIKLAPVLKRACRFVKTRSFPSQVNFYAQCKGDNLELAGLLADGIDAKLKGMDYEFLAKNSNNLIIVFR